MTITAIPTRVREFSEFVPFPRVQTCPLHWSLHRPSWGTTDAKTKIRPGLDIGQKSIKPLFLPLRTSFHRIRLVSGGSTDPTGPVVERSNWTESLSPRPTRLPSRRKGRIRFSTDSLETGSPLWHRLDYPKSDLYAHTHLILKGRPRFGRILRGRSWVPKGRVDCVFGRVFGRRCQIELEGNNVTRPEFKKVFIRQQSLCWPWHKVLPWNHYS